MSLLIKLRREEPLEIEHLGEKIVIFVESSRSRSVVRIDAPISFKINRNKIKKDMDNIMNLQGEVVEQVCHG